MAEILIGSDSSITKGFAKAVNPELGGQNGFARKPAEWVSNADHIKQDLVGVVLSLPKAMAYMPDSEARIKQLKALLELHPTNIGGMNQSLTVEATESIAGSSGEMMQSVGGVKRERSNPTLTIPNKYGKIVTRHISDWIRYLLKDEETEAPRIIAEPAYISAESPELLPDMYSMTMLFFEPNTNWTKCNEAYLCVNMWPLGITNESAKNKGDTKENEVIELSFTALTSVGESVIKLADAYLASLTRSGLTGAGLSPASSGFDANLLDDALSTSYSKSITDLANAAAGE